MVLISSSLSLGCYCSDAASLEALDAASTNDVTLDARVGGMTVRADVEHQFASYRAGGELVAARVTANLRQYEVGVASLHFHLLPQDLQLCDGPTIEQQLGSAPFARTN
jgi:hypothetical protein